MRKPGKWTPTLELAANLEIGKAMLVECNEDFSPTRLRAMLHISTRTMLWKWTVTKTKGNWWKVRKVGRWN